MFLIPQVEVQETEEKGKGIFATDIIEGGTLISDYLGQIVHSDESTDLYDDDVVFDMWYSDKVDICPDPDKPGMHTANPSCEPTCGMGAIGRRTTMFALRKIFPGEELTYEYFLGEQDEDCEAGTDNCFCESPFCRGTMYSNPMHYDAWDEHVEKMVKGESEDPPVPFGEELPPLDKYPESVEDDEIYNIFGYREEEPHKCDMESFKSVKELRKLIRETGRTLKFSDIGIIVEGVIFGGHVIYKYIR